MKQEKSATQRRTFRLGLVASALTTALVTSQVHAANWFKLRGTEPGATARTAQLWGFLQPTFINDFSEDVNTPPGPGSIDGDRPVPGTLEPDRNSSSSFFLRRARIGVRGVMTPIDNDINYFILTEWGQNGITRGSDGAAKLLDASVTFNHLSRGMDEGGLANLGMRVRVGQFLFSQTSQELSRGTPVNRPHIFFTEATQAFALNRPTVDNGRGNFKGTAVSAGRDIGIELFDWSEFKDPLFGGGPLEFTYSAALGNGGTIGELDRDRNKTQYYWLSLTKLMDDTRGPRRHELMFYGWYQRGKREFNNDINNDGLPDNVGPNLSAAAQTAGPSGGKTVIRNGNEGEFTRNYFGAGVWYFDKPFASLGQIRFEAEWQKQKGLIFDGALLPTANNNSANGGALHDPSGRSSGWSIDTGYDINGHVNDLLGTSLKRTSLNVRFDRFDRNEDNTAREVRFDTWTVSAEYHIHPKMRVSTSYAFRDFDTRNRVGAAKVVGDNILGEVGDRYGIQATMIFN